MLKVMIHKDCASFFTPSQNLEHADYVLGELLQEHQGKGDYVEELGARYYLVTTQEGVTIRYQILHWDDKSEYIVPDGTTALTCPFCRHEEMPDGSCACNE
jgi:hypothetical protein